MIGMLDLLSGSELNERQSRYARIAKGSADALLSLINQILDFSKIESGKVELEELALRLPAAGGRHAGNVRPPSRGKGAGAGRPNQQPGSAGLARRPPSGSARC